MTVDEAVQAERDFIEVFNSIENGYNVEEGGSLGSDYSSIFEYNGKKYTSRELAELSDVEGITYHDITNRVNYHGWSIEDALTKPLVHKNQLFEYKGKYYTSKELADMSDVEGLTPTNIVSRINRHHWDVERAITQPKNVKKQPMGNNGFLYEYNGKKYKGFELAQISPIEGITGEVITNRINNHGWSVERAISTPVKGRDCLYNWNGNLYTSKQLAELSPVENMTYHDITDRIRSGWSMEDVMYKPKDGKKSDSKLKHKRKHASQSEAKPVNTVA